MIGIGRWHGRHEVAGGWISLVARTLSVWPVAAVVLALAMISPAGAAASAQAAAKHCGGTPALVGGATQCLRVNAACRRRYRHDYLLAGFVCAPTLRHRRRSLRLRRAGLAERREGRILDLPSSGVPTFKQALWYFDQMVAHLPGVKTPQGAVGSDPSGTGAIKSLSLYRNRLTAAQRGVLDASITPPGQPVVVLDPTTSFSRVSARAAATGLEGITADLPEAVRRLRAHGVFFKHPIAIYAGGGDRRPTELAYTSAGWLSNKSNQCSITLGPRLLGRDQLSQRQTLLHELMHCASAELVSSSRAWNAQPKFLDEGLPEWASYRVGLEWNGTVKDLGWWPRYLSDPSLSLFTRTYDASGWWSLVEHEGADPFAIFPQLVAAGAGGSAHAVYVVARDAAHGDLLKDDWGTTLAGISAYGPRWDLKGPGETTRSEPDRGTITETSDPAVGSVDAYGADEFKVDVQADLVKVTGPQHGAGFFRDAGGTDWVLTADEQEFCTDPNGCFCSDGSELPYPKIQPGEAHVGIASEQADTATVDGTSIDKDPHCKRARSGIQVLGQGGATVAVFASGTCSLAGGKFTAHATDSGYTLDVKISGARYGQVYDLAYGGSNPTFTIKAPGGVSFSNKNVPPDAPPAGGGIGLAKNGSRMSLGFIEAFDGGISDGVKLGGAMSCRRPKKGH